MPSIQVSWKDGFMGEPVADAIKRVVRDYGSGYFSPEARKFLWDSDFSFKFLEAHRFDELTHDIIVRISPSFARPTMTLDNHAYQVLRGIVEDLGDQLSRDTTLGVEVMVDGIKGWAERNRIISGLSRPMWDTPEAKSGP